MSNYKHFTYEERIRIKELLDSGVGKCDIAKTLGVHNSSVYREIARGIPEGEHSYNPEYAQNEYNKKLSHKGRPIGMQINEDMAQAISRLILEQHMSPEKIVDYFAKDGSFADYPHSRNTIYAAIDANLIPNVSRESLNSDVTTMFSNGMICVPKWIREKFDMHDGDKLQYTVLENGEIHLRKVSSET